MDLIRLDWSLTKRNILGEDVLAKSIKSKQLIPA